MPLKYWFRHSLGEFHVCFAALALKPDERVVGVVGDLESSVLAEGAAKPQRIDGANCLPELL